MFNLLRKYWDIFLFSPSTSPLDTYDWPGHSWLMWDTSPYMKLDPAAYHTCYALAYVRDDH